MASGKKHLTAQSTQPEASDKLNRYTFLEKGSAQMDEHFKKTRVLYNLPVPHERNGVFCLRFSNDNSKLITSYGNGSIDVTNVESGQPEYVVKEETVDDSLPMMSVRCVPGNDETFFAAGVSGYIYQCKYEENSARKFLEEKLNEINCIDVNAAGTNLLSGGKDAKIRLYDIRHGRLKVKFHKANREAEDYSNTHFHAMRVFVVKFHPSEDHIFLSGGWDDVLKVWDVRIHDGCVKNIRGPRICGDALDIKDKRILTGSWTVNHSLQLWDLTSGRLIENINPINRVHTLDGEFLYCCQFFKGSKKEYILAGGSGTSTFEVINLKEMKIISSYKVNRTLQSIDSNSVSMAAFGGMDPEVKLLHVL